MPLEIYPLPSPVGIEVSAYRIGVILMDRMKEDLKHCVRMWHIVESALQGIPRLYQAIRFW